jgi:hypothetical protein
MVYFGIVALAGYLLLRRAQVGISLSAAVQIPQIVSIMTPGFLFQFTGGLLLLLQMSRANVNLSAGFDITAWVGRNPVPQASLVSINFFPLLALVGLWSIARGARDVDRQAGVGAV